MNPETKSRLKRTALFSLAALAIGATVAFVQIRLELRNEGAMPSTMNVAGADIGGPFSLVDGDGKTVTEKDFAGEYKLIYFGFTYCPAICPTELQKIAQAMKQIEAERPELAAKVQPIFISVDPERDTPEVMREYVKLYHPRLIGLTGSTEQIKDVKKKYRIYSAKQYTEGSTDYTVDHSSFIYLMGPEDTLLGIYRAADDAASIVRDLERLAKES